MNSIKHFFIISLLTASYLHTMEQPEDKVSPLAMSTEASMHSVEEIKIIAQYAIVHHKELKDIQEHYKIGLPIGPFFSALRKSYEKIKTLCIEKNNWEKVSSEIDLEFKTTIKKQTPLTIDWKYNFYSEPYYFAAQLLYFAENTQDVAVGAFQKSAHLMTKEDNNFQTKFSHKDFWSPFFDKIDSIFKAHPDVLNTFKEKSKLLYTFIEQN